MPPEAFSLHVPDATIADLATTQKIDWIRVEGNETVTVEADPRHLGRILDNLLTNALKYAEPRSPITIRVASVAGMSRMLVASERSSAPGSRHARGCPHA